MRRRIFKLKVNIMSMLTIKKALQKINKKVIFVSAGIHLSEKAIIDSLSLSHINHYKFDLKTKFIGTRLRFASKTVKAIKNFIILPKSYEYYIIQAGHTPILLLKALKIFRKKIILWINTGLPFELKANKVNFVLRYLLRYADGFISIGKMNYDVISEFFPRKPNFLVYPIITQKPRFRMTPRLNSHNILFWAGLGDKTGAYLPKRAYYKGADIVIGAFNLLKKRVPSLKLYIVGSYSEATISSLGKHKGVYFLGYVKDIRVPIEKCCVAVNPGRGDAFPLTSLETSFLGLPTIVSKYTGIKEIIEKIDKRLVSPATVNGLANALSGYFSLSLDRKLSLSKRSILAVKKFYRQYSIEGAQRNYLKFIESLDTKK